MKERIKKVLVAILFILAFLSLFLINTNNRNQAYDCRISEISADYPPDVKEQCRRLRSKQSIHI